jgi:hypothetical protein
MSPSVRLLAAAALVSGALLLTACDGATANDAGTLLTDAQIALQAGDLDEAIRLLEQAHALEPGNDAVTVLLASVYLQRDGVDLLDLDRVLLHITAPSGGLPGGGVTARGAADGRVGAACVFEHLPGAEPFDPRAVEGYDGLLASRGVIQHAAALLQVAPPPPDSLPVMPAALRPDTLCGAVVDGALVYDREAALGHLRASGLTDVEAATALAVNATARFLDGYFLLVEDLPQPTTWYRTPIGIGICGEDPEALPAQATPALTYLFEGLAALDLRNEVLGGDTASRALVEHAIEAYEALDAYLGLSCSGSA